MSRTAGIATLTVASVTVWLLVEYIRKLKQTARRIYSTMDGFTELIGDTPLVELKSLSEATGCRIVVCLFI